MTKASNIRAMKLVLLVNRLRRFQKIYSEPRITSRSRARIKIRIRAIQGRAAFIKAATS